MKRFYLVVLLITLTIFFGGCNASNDNFVPEQLDSSSEAVSITGKVVEYAVADKMTVQTDEEDVVLDISEAVIYAEPTEGDFVELLAVKDKATIIFAANELNPSDEITGYVYAVNESSFDLLNEGSIATFDNTDTDILFSDRISVGDYVAVKNREDGSAAEVEVLTLGGGKIVGELIELTDRVMAVSMYNNIFPFLIDGLILPPNLAAGDEVAVYYHGTLIGDNRAIRVEINTEVSQGGSITGVVTDLAHSVVSVQSDQGELYCFGYTPDNTFSGGRLVVGDGVKVDYSENVQDAGTVIFAERITPILYGEPSTASIDGVITRYESGYVSIRTKNSNSYGFSHNEATNIYSDEELRLGDEVTALIVRNENDFLHATQITAKGYIPTLNTLEGSVIEINEDRVTVLQDDGTDKTFIINGAVIDSPLPIMRNDNINIEYMDTVAGYPTAVSVTFIDSPTVFEPQAATLKESGVTTGEVLLSSEMLYVYGDDSRVYVFTTENTVFEHQPEIGDRVHVQYLGDPINTAEAALISMVLEQSE